MRSWSFTAVFLLCSLHTRQDGQWTPTILEVISQLFFPRTLQVIQDFGSDMQEELTNLLIKIVTTYCG